jgi:hypothetical protein
MATAMFLSVTGRFRDAAAGDAGRSIYAVDDLSCEMYISGEDIQNLLNGNSKWPSPCQSPNRVVALNHGGELITQCAPRVKKR